MQTFWKVTSVDHTVKKLRPIMPVYFSFWCLKLKKTFNILYLLSFLEGKKVMLPCYFPPKIPSRDKEGSYSLLQG